MDAITSIENKKIKEIKKLKQKKYRDQSGLFLIEGRHLVQEAEKTGALKQILLKETESFSSKVPILYVTEQILKYITELENAPSIMGICQKQEQSNLGNHLLLLDDIQDPGNLGTIIRSAVAFHIDTIILGEGCVDLYNTKVIRASQGMLFHINILRKNLYEMILILKEQDYKILGTKVTNGKNIKDVEKLEKSVIIMGNEGKGISSRILNLCDEYLYIPCNELCESLNVGVATSIILYELDQ